MWLVFPWDSVSEIPLDSANEHFCKVDAKNAHEVTLCGQKQMATLQTSHTLRFQLQDTVLLFRTVLLLERLHFRKLEACLLMYIFENMRCVF